MPKNSKHTTITILLVVLAITVLYSPATAAETGEEWDPVQPHSGDWSARYLHTVVSHDGYLWVIGGYDGSFKNDIWKSSDGVSWTQVTSSAGWSARYLHTVVSHDGYLWVIGGNTGSARLNDVWKSSDGMSWTQVTSSAGWSARSYNTAVSHDGYLWVIGGETGSARLNDVWKSSDGVSWTQVTSSADWSARYGHTTVSHDSYIYILGGLNTQALSDVWRSPLTISPTPTPTPTSTPTSTPAPGAPGTYFTASQRFGDAQLNVTFTDRSTGDPTSWLWEYRTTGTTEWETMSTSQNPTISFVSEGRYDIQLTTTNAYGEASYLRTGYIRVGESGYALNWDPELGIWTKDWFDTSSTIPDPTALWGGITAPLTALLGSLLYVWIWLVLVAGAWLYTGETTTPYVIGLISGSAIAGTAELVGQDGGIMMMIVMGFAGAGVLAKVIAGRG